MRPRAHAALEKRSPSLIEFALISPPFAAVSPAPVAARQACRSTHCPTFMRESLTCRYLWPTNIWSNHLSTGIGDTDEIRFCCCLTNHRIVAVQSYRQIKAGG